MGVVFAIVGIVLRYGDGAYHVEVELKLAFALVDEIVFHTALESHLVGESALIGNAVVEGFVVARLESEVLELCQDNQSFLHSLETGLPLGSLLAARLLQAAYLRAARLALLQQLGYVSRLIKARERVFLEHASVGTLPVMQVLVAAHLHADRCPVGQSHIFPLPAFGGNGSGGKGNRCYK